MVGNGKNDREDIPPVQTVKEWVYRNHPCKITEVWRVPPAMAESLSTIRGYHYAGYFRTALDGGYVQYEREVHVHGGLTYGDEEGWLGFDAAHASDEPGQHNADNATDVDGWLTDQVEQMADQLIEIEHREADTDQ